MKTTKTNHKGNNDRKKKNTVCVKQPKGGVIGSVADKINGEGRVWNETNYKDNSRHLPNLIKSNKAKLLNKGKKGENKERNRDREGKRETGKEGKSEEGREGEMGEGN